MTQRKKVLLTGANGFIGAAVYKQLCSKGHFVIPLVRKPIKYENEVVADFESKEFVSIISNLPKVDCILHIGAKIGWQGYARKDLYCANVLASAELARLANEMGASFVFSSAAIVHGVGCQFISMSTDENPDTDYGYSKWLAEKMIEMSGVKPLILRIGGVYGEKGPTHLGINKAIAKVLNGEPPVLVGDGASQRNYLFVNDLALIIVDAMERNVQGTHLVGGPESLSIREMLISMCEVFLPSSMPEVKPSNNKGNNQIVESSSVLLTGRSFKQAMGEIKMGLR